MKKIIANFICNRTHIVVLFFSLLFLIYYKNLTRDIYGGDVGDLVVSSYVLGVPHPSGYPLFTMLGAFFSHLSLPLPVVSRVGLVSVFSSLIVLFFYYRLALKATKDYVIVLLSTSILAFSYLFWLYTELPEVFALNNALALCVLYFSVQFYQKRKIKYLYLLVFFVGLSITHHQTIIFIFPSVCILIFKHTRFIFASWKRVGYLALLFLSGLLPYVYVPIAASRNPVVNWDQASNLTNFIRLILRKDYGIAPSLIDWVPLNYKIILLKDYLITQINEVTLPIFIASIFGGIFLFKRDKRLFFSFFSAYFFFGFFFVYYSAPALHNTFWLGVIERFRILPVVILLLFLPYGLAGVKEFAKKILPRPIYAQLIIIGLFSIPAMLFIYNNSQTDLSHTKIGTNLGIDILSSLPPRSVLFLEGDAPVFNTWYVSYVLGMRSDVILFNNHRVNIDSFKKFGKEFGKNYLRGYKDSGLIITVDESLLFDLIRKYPVFFNSQKPSGMRGIIYVPRGLVYQFMKKIDIPSEQKYIAENKSVWQKMHLPIRDELSVSERGLTLSVIPTYYADALTETGNFINNQYRDLALARTYYKKAIEVDYEYAEAYKLLGLSDYLLYNNCTEAEKNLQKAVENSNDESYLRRTYLLLYTIYNKCGNKKMQHIVEINYYSLFNKQIQDDLYNRKNKSK